jgi:hypothetical protein
MEDTADDAAVVFSASSWLVTRHKRLDRRPLLIVQPKQFPAHDLLPQKIGPRVAVNHDFLSLLKGLIGVGA